MIQIYAGKLNKTFHLLPFSFPSFTYHHAHKINNGCKITNLIQAINGVTVRVPNFSGASPIMLMCTGKKAISINIIPQAATVLVFGNINIKANSSSKQPARIFTSICDGM